MTSLLQAKFIEYTGNRVSTLHRYTLQHLGKVRQVRCRKNDVIIDGKKEGCNKRTDSTVQDENSRSGNDTDADDADIRPIYNEEPMAEVQLTVECNIFAIEQQHTKQPKIINEDRVDQYPETLSKLKVPMLDSSSLITNN
ncbi:hypothetical protein Tco_0412166 [Tanacetum coccineum]